MAPFIHSARNGIHIVNLPHTVAAWDKARAAIVELASRGGNILFVGTKKQASDAIAEEARRCGAFYVSHRWLGGMITNFQTIRKSIDRLQKIETTRGSTRFTKKERLMMSREREKLELSLGGIRTMVRAPQMMFVVDIKREDIAIREAARLDIPVVALVDTNCDPRTVDHPIPSNDDGTRAIRLFCAAVADAMMEGKAKLSDRRAASAGVAEAAAAGGVSTNPTFKPIEVVTKDSASKAATAKPKVEKKAKPAEAKAAAKKPAEKKPVEKKAAAPAEEVEKK
ncbi:UNVERIFIED_CONTAM: hypothetical protein GTU68_042327 [Idotea baltica]|nr:hypothetical protein [Idotea baltica]